MMNWIFSLLILCTASKHMASTPLPTPTEAPARVLKMQMEKAMPTPTPTRAPKQAVRFAPKPTVAPELLIENGVLIGARMIDDQGVEKIIPLNPPPVFDIRIVANTSSGVTPVDADQLFKSTKPPVVEVKSK